LFSSNKAVFEHDDWRDLNFVILVLIRISRNKSASSINFWRLMLGTVHRTLCDTGNRSLPQQYLTATDERRRHLVDWVRWWTLWLCELVLDKEWRAL